MIGNGGDGLAEKSRTEYSAKNTSIALISRILYMLFGYVARIIFTRVFNEDYVGINGLFTDILSILSLSELGFGTAITFALYKPIAENDLEKQKTLMDLFRKIYTVIALVILVLGLLLIPFFGILMKNSPKVDHIVIIYLLYLMNTVLSYVATYRKTLISAHQLNYIPVLISTLFWTGQNIIQIIILLTTRNFILYLCINLISTVGTNIVCTIKANRMYPFLLEKNITPLDKGERQGIVRNVKAMFLHKISGVLVGHTDNLLLSSMISTGVVGVYSNYVLLTASVKQILDQVFEGIAASVGNLGAVEERGRIKQIFEATFFMGQWFYGLCSICLFMVLDDFVRLSFGENYVFAREITFVICLNFFITGMRRATLVFRDSMGLFFYDRYKAIPEAVINLVVSIVLCNWLGTIGIFIGTAVSSVTTSVWVEPYVLYKYKLKISSIGYFIRFAIYTAVTFAAGYLTYLTCLALERIITYNDNPVLYIMIKGVIAIIITNTIYLTLYFKTPEFRIFKEKIAFLIKKKMKKQ